MFGSPGYGVQIGLADPTVKVGFSYVTNTIRSTINGDDRWRRLIDAVYKALDDIEKS